MNATLSLIWTLIVLLESVLPAKSVAFGNATASRKLLGTTLFHVAVLRVFAKRLAEKSNEFSSLRRQQDGKTVSYSKKGYIHMRAHAYAHGPTNSEKSVFRLADLVGGVGQ